MGNRFDDLADWDTLHIYVTKKDIREGNRQCATTCPIANSLARRGVKGPWVAYHHATGDVGDAKVTLDLPESAINFIQRFDGGRRVKPFRCTLKRRR